MKRLAATVLGMVLTGACGGGGAAPSAPPTTPPTIAASAAPRATATAAAPTVNADQAFIDLVKSAKVQYKVTYTVTGLPAETTIVQYSKPPSSRMDMTMKTSGITVAQSFYVRADGEFQCGSLIPGTAPTCSKSSGSGPGEGPAKPAPDDLSRITLTAAAPRTVLGVTARCFTLSGPDVGTENVVECFNTAGVPLYISSAAGTWTATAVSTTVADSDFDLPYPIAK